MRKQSHHRRMPILCHVLWAAFAASVAGGSPVQAKTCLFGDATYVKMQQDPQETKLVLEPVTHANGIFLRRGKYRHQFFLDMPNNPPPGYQMGNMDPLTEMSYPTFYPQGGGRKQINGWPGSDEPAPGWIVIKGLGRFSEGLPELIREARRRDVASIQ